MTPELLAMLTPEEAKAWALCEGATPGPWVDMTSAGSDGGAFNGEIRAALSFTHICSDVPGDDRESDRAFIAGSRDALPAALTTIATLRDELRAVADLIQEVGVLGIASTMDAVVVSGQPSARDLLTWAAKAMDAWPEERQTLRAEVAELRATLANDRGEGEPPSEGWKWNQHARFWHRGSRDRTAYWNDFGRSWWWQVGDTTSGPYKSARSAMKAADDAVKGAT